MNLKQTDEHVTYPARFAGLVKKTLSAQLPDLRLGRFTNFISEHSHVQFVDDTLRMEAVPGVVLVSNLIYRFTRAQLQARPRIKLLVGVKLILVLLLVLTTLGVEKLQAKKPDIKVNGQAILIAEDVQPNNDELQIDVEVLYKENPLDYKMPVKGYISQNYRNYHRAIDIATGKVGVPIVALGKGKVDFAGFTADGKGNVVIVDHGDGLKSLYAHMGKITVAVGNEVDSTITIGTVGLTGRTTGAHVHLEVYDNGIAVDPGGSNNSGESGDASIGGGGCGFIRDGSGSSGFNAVQIALLFLPLAFIGLLKLLKIREWNY